MLAADGLTPAAEAFYVMPQAPLTRLRKVPCVYDEVTRNMNARERDVLSEIVGHTAPPVTLAGTLKWVSLWAGGIALCALAAAALISLDVNPVIGGIIGGPLAIAAIICLYAIIALVGAHRRWSRTHRDFMRHHLPEIRKAIENGSVFVKRVSATAVIEIVEFEDEGSGYIYDGCNPRSAFPKSMRDNRLHGEC